MYIIGVTGGIGAGKSRVLDYLEGAHDAVIVRLDDVSREMLAVGGACYEDAIRLFGEEIRGADGELNRSLIAKRIFEREELREALDALIHPAVKTWVQERIEKERKEGTALLVIEAALLIEDHYDAFCDEMWYIYADVNTRYSRLASSRGYDEARIRGTMARQLSEEEFRAGTDFEVDNSGDFAAAARAIDEHLTQIRLRGKT